LVKKNHQYSYFHLVVFGLSCLLGWKGSDRQRSACVI